MRVMVLVKASPESEAGVMPSEKLITDMGNYNQRLADAGVMRAGEGLHPTSRGKRVRFAASGTSVIDGPFTETKELLAGFWVWHVDSMEHAVEWLKQAPFEDCEIEIRPVFEAEDFGEEFTPEARAQEDRIREQTAALERGEAPAPAFTPNIFVNLPVKDLARSVEFFTTLGYTFNPNFSNENGTCMVISDTIYAMLLVEPFFSTFTPKQIADAKVTTETLVALSMPSREAVEAQVNKALAAGARHYADPKDHGFMFQWGFEDLDGHIWELFWMDPAAVPPSAG
jgi:predicted lactoylglutathione lyase